MPKWSWPTRSWATRFRIASARRRAVLWPAAPGGGRRASSRPSRSSSPPADDWPRSRPRPRSTSRLRPNGPTPAAACWFAREPPASARSGRRRSGSCTTPASATRSPARRGTWPPTRWRAASRSGITGCWSDGWRRRTTPVGRVGGRRPGRTRDHCGVGRGPAPRVALPGRIVRRSRVRRRGRRAELRRHVRRRGRGRASP